MSRTLVRAGIKILFNKSAAGAVLAAEAKLCTGNAVAALDPPFIGLHNKSPASQN